MGGVAIGVVTSQNVRDILTRAGWNGLGGFLGYLFRSCARHADDAVTRPCGCVSLALSFATCTPFHPAGCNPDRHPVTITKSAVVSSSLAAIHLFGRSSIFSSLSVFVHIYVCASRIAFQEKRKCEIGYTRVLVITVGCCCVLGQSESWIPRWISGLQSAKEAAPENDVRIVRVNMPLSVPKVGQGSCVRPSHHRNQFRFYSMAVHATAPSPEEFHFSPSYGSPSRAALRIGTTMPSKRKRSQRCNGRKPFPCPRGSGCFPCLDVQLSSRLFCLSFV